MYHLRASRTGPFADFGQTKTTFGLKTFDINILEILLVATYLYAIMENIILKLMCIVT